MDFGSIPKSLTVVLEDDLVDKCKPGDDATISGFLFLRWKPFKTDQKMECELTFKANHIQVCVKRKNISVVNKIPKEAGGYIWLWLPLFCRSIMYRRHQF